MRKDVIVVGAGLGGISAAICLRQAGYRVLLLEKNAHIGGKLNLLKAEGFSFDLGPSILTLPHIFERLFAGSGKKMEDYVKIISLSPHWRNIFPDGKEVDLYGRRDLMEQEMEKLGPGVKEDFNRFLTYASGQYDLIEEGYFEKGLDTIRDFIRFYPPSAAVHFDFLRSMHGGVSRHIRNPYLQTIFDFFIKYVGSSAYDAPGFMNCLPIIQFRHDLWYVPGGMYNLARGLERLMREIGVEIRTRCDVERILKEGKSVRGVRLSDGEDIMADVVVSNMEVIPTYRSLLCEDARFLRKLRRFEPACSGLIIDLGLDTRYEQLAHHNFLYSGNQKKHFRSVFHEKVLPEDPTIYLVAAARSDDSVAPPGGDALKILPHIPHLEKPRRYTQQDYMAYKDRILDKLEAMGLKNLRRHVVFEHVWTPLDIEQMYRSNQGSIYGVVSDRWKNLAFKAPKHSTRYDNLFFTGGSVNPGGGMPMVVLCGQNTAKAIQQWDQ